MTYISNKTHMKPHSSKPQDEIYNLSYVLMCLDNWIWNTEPSIQMVTGAISLTKKALHWRAGLFHSTAVKHQRCGALIEFSLPTCLVMARFPFWKQNLPMLQNTELWGHWVLVPLQALCLCTRRPSGPGKLNPFYLQLGNHVSVNLTICFSTSLSVYSCISIHCDLLPAPANAKLQDINVNMQQ